MFSPSRRMFSMDAFTKEGLMALNRANMRNMERLAVAVGGVVMEE